MAAGNGRGHGEEAIIMIEGGGRGSHRIVERHRMRRLVPEQAAPRSG